MAGQRQQGHGKPGGRLRCHPLCRRLTRGLVGLWRNEAVNHHHLSSVSWSSIASFAPHPGDFDSHGLRIKGRIGFHARFGIQAGFRRIAFGMKTCSRSHPIERTNHLESLEIMSYESGQEG